MRSWCWEKRGQFVQECDTVHHVCINIKWVRPATSGFRMTGLWRALRPTYSHRDIGWAKISVCVQHSDASLAQMELQQLGFRAGPRLGNHLMQCESSWDERKACDICEMFLGFVNNIPRWNAIEIFISTLLCMLAVILQWLSQMSEEICMFRDLILRVWPGICILQFRFDLLECSSCSKAEEESISRFCGSTNLTIRKS